MDLLTRKVHVLAIPYPALGHVNPLLQLSQQLVATGFMVTFVVSGHNYEFMLQSGMDLSATGIGREELGIRLVILPGGSNPEWHDSQVTIEAVLKSSEDMAKPFEELLLRLMRDEHPVSFIISDVLMSWTQELANATGIPRVAFVPFSATVYWSILNRQKILSEFEPSLQEKEISDRHNAQRTISYIPGIPSIRLIDIPFTLGEAKVADAIVNFLGRQVRHLSQSSRVLINSWYSLEKQVLHALEQSGNTTYPVGPLCSMPINGDRESLAAAGTEISSYGDAEDCLSWLHRQRLNSVLYISFGTVNKMAEAQCYELAAGLEASEHPFLWVFRPSFVDDPAVSFPEGFLDRIKLRGRIVPWCPQVQVLASPSVGAFLTHCGWNSIIESISMGVPPLCWPTSGEQRMNARLVVDVWKVGLDCRGTNEGIVRRDQVERAIRDLMHHQQLLHRQPNGGGGDGDLRQRIDAMRASAQKEVRDGGSSFNNLQNFFVSLNK